MHKFLSLIVAIALLYLIFESRMGWRSGPEEPATSPSEQSTLAPAPETVKEPEITGGFVERTLSRVLINVLKTEQGRIFMENILTPANKPLTGGKVGYKINNDNLISALFKINSFGEGTEGPASCGHLVKVHYKVLMNNDVVIKEATEAFPVGSKSEDIPGLDPIIVGMRVGETRQATVPNKYIHENGVEGKRSYKIHVSLLEVMPKNFVGDDVKIFDDEIAYHLPLLCGQRTIFNAKVTRLTDGKVMYNSKDKGTKLNMQIGNVVYPLIFSHALHNKIPVGTRTVIAKGQLFKSFAANTSHIFPETPLPVQEYFMLELSDFEDVKKPPQ